MSTVGDIARAWTETTLSKDEYPTGTRSISGKWILAGEQCYYNSILEGYCKVKELEAASQFLLAGVCGTVSVSGPITITGPVDVNVTNSVLTVQSGGTGISITGPVTVTVSGTVEVSGKVEITNATITVEGNVTVSGKVEITNSVINVAQSGNWTINAVQSGTWNIGTITSITGPVTITGKVEITNAYIPVSQSGDWNITVSGTVNIAGGTINIQTAGGVEISVGKQDYVPIGREIQNDGGTGELVALDAHHYGKFLPSGMRGMLYHVKFFIWNDSGGLLNVVLHFAIRPGSPDIFSLSGTIPNGSNNWDEWSVQKYWDYDSMFVWIEKVTAENTGIKRDLVTYGSNADFYWSDDAVNWIVFSARLWIRILMETQTHYPVPVEGTVSIKNIDQAVDISDDVTRQLGVIKSITDPVTVTGTVSISGSVDVSDRAPRLLGKVYGDQDVLAQRATTKELKVQIQHQGTEKDPTQIRALTSSDVVDVSDRAARLLGKVYGSEGLVVKQKATTGELQAEVSPLPGSAFDVSDRAARALGKVYGSEGLVVKQKASTGELQPDIVRWGGTALTGRDITGDLSFIGGHRFKFILNQIVNYTFPAGQTVTWLNVSGSGYLLSERAWKSGDTNSLTNIKHREFVDENYCELWPLTTSDVVADWGYGAVGRYDFFATGLLHIRTWNTSTNEFYMFANHIPCFKIFRNTLTCSVQNVGTVNSVGHHIISYALFTASKTIYVKMPAQAEIFDAKLLKQKLVQNGIKPSAIIVQKLGYYDDPDHMPSIMKEFPSDLPNVWDDESQTPDGKTVRPRRHDKADQYAEIHVPEDTDTDNVTKVIKPAKLLKEEME